VRARFLRGRLERGSAEVGIDSGMGSDIVAFACSCKEFLLPNMCLRTLKDGAMNSLVWRVLEYSR
jgi:hypothetical protein